MLGSPMLFSAALLSSMASPTVRWPQRDSKSSILKLPWAEDEAVVVADRLALLDFVAFVVVH